MKQDCSASRRVRLRAGAAAVAVVALTVSGGWMSVPATAAGAAPTGTVCTPTEGFVGCRLFTPPVTGDGKGTFAVPANVEALDVRVWGEGGAGGPGTTGGAGGLVRGTLKVTPGESLTVAVGGRGTGDAFGGASGGSHASRGGNSSAIRTADGAALVVAGGGGGGSSNVSSGGTGGNAGGESGTDATEAEGGGKGAVKGTGGAGGGGGAAGKDASEGGAGGAGEKTSRYGGGGGGAGYAGGGGGAGSAEDDRRTAGGGGGSSYAHPKRMSDVRLLTGEGSRAPAEDDPFWEPSDNPVDSGVAEGGPNAPGGPGRVVLQWKGTVPTELSAVSGDNQVVDPGHTIEPLAALVRDKDGKPVERASVTFEIEDPDKLGVTFEDDRLSRKVVVATDAQGRAGTPHISAARTEGAFTVRATSAGLTKVFELRVKTQANEVEAVGGDGQRTLPGQPFPERLQVLVTDDGEPAPGARVDFLIEASRFDGAPVFRGGVSGVAATADAEGRATAPRDIVAGDVPGTYTVTAKVPGGAGTTFTVEVVDKTAEPSATPSPGASDGTGGTGGDGDQGGTGGTGDGTAGGGSGDGGSSTGLLGGLADTGAGGIGLLVTAALGLAAVGFAAVRFSPRLRPRSRRG
ncbi:glycine-rich protein [Streptomyces pilosus]|uniref:glycine-rich domain-containing protein n=1 Tax=Streptomyces pilosus TaxID=28893 RepID=UPI00368FF04D